jgi:uncharacterized coiled-coil protein SlyX
MKTREVLLLVTYFLFSFALSFITTTRLSAQQPTWDAATQTIRQNAEGGNTVLKSVYSYSGNTETNWLIGNFAGWDRRAIYIGGYNSTNAAQTTAFSNKVVIGGAGSNLPLFITGNVFLQRERLEFGLVGNQMNIAKPLGSETGRYEITFRGWRDAIPDQIGAKICAIRVNNFQANNALVQATELAFFTGSGWEGLPSAGADAQFERLRIDKSGNVGVGTSTPAYKLDVAGVIRAHEVLVELPAPPPGGGGGDENPHMQDVVFEADYKLRSLAEVDSFIQAHKHLPEIPSAKEVEEKGLGVVDMQMRLLRKVEELTLYLISQEKTIKAQSVDLARLKAELRAMNKSASETEAHKNHNK